MGDGGAVVGAGAEVAGGAAAVGDAVVAEDVVTDLLSLGFALACLCVRNQIQLP